MQENVIAVFSNCLKLRAPECSSKPGASACQIDYEGSATFKSAADLYDWNLL